MGRGERSGGEAKRGGRWGREIEAVAKQRERPMRRGKRSGA